MPVPSCRQPVSPERPPGASRPRQRRCVYWTSKPSLRPSHNLNLCEELIENIGIHNAAREVRALTENEITFLPYSAAGYTSLKQRYLDGKD